MKTRSKKKTKGYSVLMVHTGIEYQGVSCEIYSRSDGKRWFKSPLFIGQSAEENVRLVVQDIAEQIMTDYSLSEEQFNEAFDPQLVYNQVFIEPKAIPRGGG